MTMTRLTNASYVKIGLLVVLALVLCGGIVSCSVRCTPSFQMPASFYNDVDVDAHETGAGAVAGADVRNIAIAWAAGSATITVCDDAETGGQIVFAETGSGVRNLPLRWGCENGTLCIQYTSERNLMGCSTHGSKHLDVKVPRSVAQTLGFFELDVASGDYALEGLACGKMAFAVASGTVEGADLSAGELRLDVASGQLALAGDFPETVNANMGSGNTSISTAHCPQRVDVDMASGMMTFALPSACAFEVDYDALSGKVDSSFPVRGGSAMGSSPSVGGSAVYGDANAEVTGHFDVDMASGMLAFQTL